MTEDLIAQMLFMIVGIMIGLTIGMAIPDKQKEKLKYKEGQIDALNGKVKYELKENDDKEIVWEEMNLKKSDENRRRNKK